MIGRSLARLSVRDGPVTESLQGQLARMKQKGIGRPVLLASHIRRKFERGGSEHSSEVQILLRLRAG